jgi:Protein of unknown function (DUF3485)
MSTTAATRSPYSQPAFIAAVVILAVAAIGLNGAVAKMQLHFKKMPVPLRRDLTDIPRQLGDWMQISMDEPLEHDTQEVLGTDRYIFRDYLNIRAHGGQCAADLIMAFHAKDDPPPGLQLRADFLAKTDPQRIAALEAELEKQTADQRKEAIAHVQGLWPDSVINMAVTYYTGLVDTVAHIPERCYIADGFEPTSTPDTPVWKLDDGRQLTVRFINFEDQSGAARISRSVAYFFQVNGRYEDNPEGVRFSLQNLFAKYGYYAKVELMTLDPSSVESAHTMTAFISSAIGELEKTLPDWKKVTGSQG